MPLIGAKHKPTVQGSRMAGDEVKPRKTVSEALASESTCVGVEDTTRLGICFTPVDDHFAAFLGRSPSASNCFAIT